MSAAEQIDEIPGPQPGPQTLFATTTADVAVIGGGAGGGKSVALIYEGGKLTALEHARAVRCVMFRREEKDLKRGGGLWDRSFATYPAFGGSSRATPSLDWTFEAASRRVEDRHRIEFRHLQLEGSVYSHDGTEYDLVGFDELQQFTARQFWYLFSRLRSTSGVRPRVRATCNPLAGSWLYELVAWWIGSDGYALPERSGVLRWFVRDPSDDSLAWFDSREAALEAFPDDDPISFTFIVSTLDDNPALTRRDPSYRGRLRKMVRSDRMRLLGEKDEHGRDRGGNWITTESAGLFFKAADFVIVDAPPSPIARTCRAWDKGASVPTPKHPDPDWTEGVRVSLLRDGSLYVDDLVSMRARPVEVLDAMRATAEGDGRGTTIAIYQDTGGAGKTDAEVTREFLMGFPVEIIDSFGAGASGPKPKTGASRPKREFARAWAPMVEGKRVFVRRAEWTQRLIRQCDAFPEGAHDDIVDALSCAAQVLISKGGMFAGTGLVDAARKMRGWG